MRRATLLRLVLLLLAGLAAPATATPTLITCSNACAMPDGTTQPAGTATSRVDWDGVTSLQLPPGKQAVPDDGRAVYVPVFPAIATAAQLAALALTVPTPASTVPSPATPAGKAGTSTAFVPSVASEPSLTRSVRVTTLADGTFAVTWSVPLISAAPVANVVPINTGSQPAICNPTAVTAQGVAGRCWMLTTPTLSVLGAQINVASSSSAAGLTVSVYAREPSP